MRQIDEDDKGKGSSVKWTQGNDETERILQEIRDHAVYWHSDRAKRITVEKHLKQKGMKDVEAKIDALIKAGKLTLIPQSRGDYLQETTR